MFAYQPYCMFTLILIQLTPQNLASKLHFIFPVLLSMLVLLIIGVILFVTIKNKMRALR